MLLYIHQIPLSINIKKEMLQNGNLLHNAKLNIEFDIKGKYDEIESAKKQIALAKQM